MSLQRKERRKRMVTKNNIKNFFDKVWEVFSFLGENIKFILVVIALILTMCLVKQCNNYQLEKSERERLENNIAALNDTLKNYNKNGLNYAEMRALRLRVNELADSLKLEKGKTPVTIINYNTSINDTIYLESKPVHDTVFINSIYTDKGVVVSEKNETFGKSNRYINVKTPYTIDKNTGVLLTDTSTVVVRQNIWMESTLYKDKKNNTYIRLTTDYPSVVFNNGLGVLVENGKEYSYKERKSFGVGLGVQVGYGFVFPNGNVKISPYVGIGVGLQWNPKFLQF